MKKILSVIACLVLILSACGSENTKATNELVLWGGFTGLEQESIEEIIEVYNEQNGDNPDVKYYPQQDIENKLITSLVSGGAPDIVIWDRFNTLTYAKKDAFTELDTLISENNTDTSIFYEEAYKEMNVDGVQYGLPTTVDTRVLFYNKDLFDSANLEYPTDDWTWDDLTNAAKQCTKTDANGSMEVAGFDLSDTGLYNMWIAQAGGEVVNSSGEAAFNSEEGKSVLDQWSKFLDDGSYKNGYIGGDSGLSDAFASGNLCMKYDGPWALGALDSSDVNFGTVKAVSGPSGDNSTIIGGFGLAIPRDAKNVDLSYDFIQWYTTKDEAGTMYYDKTGNLPANKNIMEIEQIQNNENVSTISSQLDNAIARPVVSGYGDVESLALRPELDKFMAGEQSAQEALDNAEVNANNILNEAK